VTEACYQRIRGFKFSRLAEFGVNKLYLLRREGVTADDGERTQARIEIEPVTEFLPGTLLCEVGEIEVG